MEIFKNIMFVLLGVALAVGIFSLIVAIGCSVNGISFGQQIVEWFGTNAPAVEEVADTIVETVSNVPIV